MNKLFESGVVDKPPKKVLADVLLRAREEIGKGEDDWDTRDTCRAIEMLPEKYRSMFLGVDAVCFKNMMQRLRKDKVVPKVRPAKDMQKRFEKFVRDYEKNRDRRGQEHLSKQYVEYVVEGSDEWRNKAREHKDRCSWRCQLCGKQTSSLEVHHTAEGYRNLKNEMPWHLLAVCATPCHPIADMMREGWFASDDFHASLLEDDI